VSDETITTGQIFLQDHLQTVIRPASMLMSMKHIGPEFPGFRQRLRHARETYQTRSADAAVFV
jgi:hypothetical protein